MIQIYAITDDPRPPAPPVVIVPCHGLIALCAPAETGEVTPDTLWRHEEVVESLMEDRELLPVRFGTVLPDEAAVTSAIAERREELATGLDRVRGMIELAVRAELANSPSPPGPAATGRAYMEAKTARHESAKRLHDSLAEHAQASLVRPGPELLRAAYLVRRDDVERFVTAVRELQARHAELKVICTGPWPPYSFAEGSS